MQYQRKIKLLKRPSEYVVECAAEYQTRCSTQPWWTIDRTLRKKLSFSLRISSVNVTKSAVSCEFGHIYRRNPKWNTSFFVQWKLLDFIHILSKFHCVHQRLSKWRFISSAMEGHFEQKFKTCINYTYDFI